MSFLTGKPSKSSNTNNGLLTSIYSPVANEGAGATANLSSLLTGTGDTGAANAGYQNYLQMAGYQPAMTHLAEGITGQGAAAGLLNSGSTSKALVNQGGQLNQSFYNNYLQQLLGLGNLGTQAGGIISGAGQTSTGSTPSLLSSIGQAAQGVGTAAALFSDRRLKTDIIKLREEPDGLGVYEFRYRGATNRWVGVMAEEVEKLRPWAMGPKIAGLSTVDYSRL